MKIKWRLCGGEQVGDRRGKRFRPSEEGISWKYIVCTYEKMIMFAGLALLHL
jgi:hypothetical protein